MQKGCKTKYFLHWQQTQKLTNIVKSSYLFYLRELCPDYLKVQGVFVNIFQVRANLYILNTNSFKMITLHWSKYMVWTVVYITFKLFHCIVYEALKDLFERSCSKRVHLKCCINNVQTGTLTRQLTWKVLLKLV